MGSNPAVRTNLWGQSQKMPKITKAILLKIARQRFQEIGWKAFSFEDLALLSGASLAQIYAIFPSKEDIYLAFTHQINQETLEQVHLEDLTSLKERLFELIVCRLECLDPYRLVIQEIYDSSIRDPCQCIFITRNIKKNLLWMMRVSGCRSKGFSQILFLNTFFSLYIVTFYKWLQDQTKDKAQTLSFLDQSLTRVLPLFQAFEKIY